MEAYPTPDQIAIAIVAACEETGENPIRVASGELGSRARHYALWALAHFFPPPMGDSDAKWWLGKAVGGSGYSFYAASKSATFGPHTDAFGRTRPHAARWFNADAYQRVKDAVDLTIDIGPKMKGGPQMHQETLPAFNDFRTTKKPRTDFNTGLIMRRKPVPPERCQNMTAEFFGDPPFRQSALAEHIEREMQRQERIAQERSLS